MGVGREGGREGGREEGEGEKNTSPKKGVSIEENDALQSLRIVLVQNIL
jgi:hypothetical protein